MNRTTIMKVPYFCAIFVLIILQTYCEKGFASIDAADISSVKALIHASNLHEFEQLKRAEETLKQQQLICDAQLRSALIPFSCFQVLDLELKFARIEAEVAQTEMNRINRICSERASTSQNREHLRKALNVLRENEKSEMCVKAVRQRFEDLSYMDEQKNPAALFNRRND